MAGRIRCANFTASRDATIARVIYEFIFAAMSADADAKATRHFPAITIYGAFPFSRNS